jgi:hypothetical protein
VGLRACLDTETRGKYPFPLLGMKPLSSGPSVCIQTLHWVSYPGSQEYTCLSLIEQHAMELSGEFSILPRVIKQGARQLTLASWSSCCAPRIGRQVPLEIILFEFQR